MEYPFKCLIDDSRFQTLEHFHLYLRKLKIKQANYYEKYMPRKDLGTGEAIKYKDYEQYFSTDFLNKNSLKRYIKQNPEKGKEWAINWLKKRKESKGLIYAPTQVELRSLMCPTMHYYESIGGYNLICESLGYKIRFNGDELKQRSLVSPILIQDTREKVPFISNFKTVIKTLKFGDYTLDGVDNIGLYIERKSLQDMVQTCGKNLGRFEREIVKAEKAGAYIVVLVESDLNSALSFNFLPQFRWTKQVPSHIFKNIRDLLHKFNNIQFLFVDGRKEASIILEKVLIADGSVKNIDLQYKYELGELL